LRKKVAIWIILAVLVASIFPFEFAIRPAKGETIVVPVQYSSIQAAVDAASSGDSIRVLNGTYYEGVHINKSLSLIGENSVGTIIDGHVMIEANDVQLKGFTIRGGTGWGPGVGLYMWDSNNCTISNNIIISCIHPYGDGIWISHSNNNTISENLITLNAAYGIDIDEGSSHNKIVNNTISYNAVSGIFIVDWGDGRCIDNVITANNIQYNENWNIAAASCSENIKIIGNKMTDSHYGVFFGVCGSHPSYPCNATISDNWIANCDHGISISGAYGNSISGNTVTNCAYGISFTTDNNTVYHNNFINNAQQVNEKGANTTWDDGYPSGGNYWSDYNGTDANGDGIGDIPYIIDEYNWDNYPLMYPDPFLIGDINCDAQVDIYDVTAVCVAYNSKSGDSNWYPPADIAEPYGIIDIYDVTAVCINYGKKWLH
jgi:parallel beta-helix repeat protein